MTIDKLLAPGIGDLNKLILQADDGASVEVYEHGAQITSWQPADDSERLFLSSQANFAAGQAIRGGVPIIFPQFATLGPLPKHGFARTLPWRCVKASRGAQAFAEFHLQDTEQTRALWPHAFVAKLVIRVSGAALSIGLSVYNNDHTPFEFTAALHTYLRVQDLAQVSVRGLQGLPYRDNAASTHATMQQTAVDLRIMGAIDRTYFATEKPITVVDQTARMQLKASGFHDTIIWNPGATSLPDLAAEEYRNMLCVEAAAVAEPIRLPPASTWKGHQELLVQQ